MNITRVATGISMLLWFLAAYFWALGFPSGFAIISILAALSQVIGVNSARREGAAPNKDFLRGVTHGKK